MTVHTAIQRIVLTLFVTAVAYLVSDKLTSGEPIGVGPQLVFRVEGLT